MNKQEYNYINIGKYRDIRFIHYENEIIGLEELHPKFGNKNQTCGSTIFFDEDGWDLLCQDPLVVWPSIVCKNCNSHGFIIEGTWLELSSMTPKINSIIKDYIDGKHPNQK